MAEGSMTNKKILIIDDDPDQRLSLRLPLESAGFLVHEAANSAQGLVAAKQFLPDLIILDVMMDTATLVGSISTVPTRVEPKSSEDLIMLTAIHSTTPLRFATMTTAFRWSVFSAGRSGCFAAKIKSYWADRRAKCVLLILECKDNCEAGAMNARQLWKLSWFPALA
jgi:CheY-like chemotaxis protein